MKMPHARRHVVAAALAHATAPMARTSAPGFYRTMLGAFEVTVLFDGALSMPVDKFMTNTSTEQVAALLAQESLGIPGTWSPSSSPIPR
jgi:hypothetical protein